MGEKVLALLPVEYKISYESRSVEATHHVRYQRFCCRSSLVRSDAPPGLGSPRATKQRSAEAGDELRTLFAVRPVLES